MNKPVFSIVTPCLNALPYLRLCCASVADQKGVDVEHIVVDGGSTDGTVEWLQAQSRSGLHWISEKDSGMYAAINKGFKIAQGELIAHLNSDEQYLPGALELVAKRFSDNSFEILLGDTIVIDTDGSYLCSRQVIKPMYYHTLVCHLSTFTAATFFRKSALERYSAYFDEKWKCSGDLIWMLNILNNKAKIEIIRHYTSAFMDRGKENLALSNTAFEERKKRLSGAPTWAKYLRHFWSMHHRMRRFFYGLYRLTAFSYSLYTPDSPECRIEFHVTRPTFLWKSRLSRKR